MLAALARLADEGMVAEVPVTVERSDGKPYTATGHCVAADRGQFKSGSEIPGPRGAEPGNHFEFDLGEGSE